MDGAPVGHRFATRPAFGRRAAIAAAAVIASVTTTCREATGPRFTLDVEITDILGPQLATGPSGQRLVTCSVALVAHGVGKGIAAWRSAEFFFYVPSRTTAMDSAEVPDTTIGDSWGNSAISADSVERSRWQLSAEVPFSVAIRYRWEVFDGPRDSTEVTVPCRFNVPAGGAPTITNLASDPSSDPEPGKAVALDFGISSAVGLWQTAIQLAGPCDTAMVVLDDSLEHSLARVVRMPVPSSCDPGVSLVASVAALDANYQSSARSITLPPLVDTTPPTVSEVEGPFCPTTPYTTGMPPTCFTGDSLLLVLAATDNRSLAYLVWDLEPVGYRDSVAVQGPVTGATVQIPVAASWVGANRITVYARDASGNVSVPIRNSMQILPTLTAPATVAAIPATIYDVAIDTLRNSVYLLESEIGQIAVFSPAAGADIDSIALGETARYFDLTPSGDSIITSLVSSRSLGVVDLRQTPLVLTKAPLALDSATEPWYLRVTSTGAAFLLEIGAGGHAYTYNLRTGILRRRLDAGNAGETGGGPMGRSYDRSVVVINSTLTQVYDAATDAFGPLQASSLPGAFPAIDGNGSHIAIGTGVYDGSLRGFSSTWETLSALSPDGQTGYSVEYGRLGIIRTRLSDGALLDRVMVKPPILPSSNWPVLSWLSPNGKAMVIAGYVPSLGTSGIAIVDLTRIAPATVSQRLVPLARVTPQNNPATARPAAGNQLRVHTPWSFRPVSRLAPDATEKKSEGASSHR